jgi:putative ATP-dependent endonuclease of the OLD family
VKISNVEVKHLRCLKKVEPALSDYTCLVGPNGAGKSTLLCALNIFFRNLQGSVTDLSHLGEEDFHHQDTKQKIEVTVTFTDLSDEAKNDFKDYVRQDKLIVSAIAEFNPQTKTADVKQFGSRMGMAQFAPFFAAKNDGAKSPDLRKIYDDFRAKDFPDLPAWKSIEGASSALRAYEASQPTACIPLLSEDQFYGISRGVGLLEKYVQWVYVPAVKQATEEETEGRNTALGKLLARTVRAKVDFGAAVESLLTDARKNYEKILEDNQSVLSELSTSLEKRLQEWAHPNTTLRLEWQQDAEKAVRADSPIAGVIAGEANFHGKLGRFGHGFQRSFLLALLQELATSDDAKAPHLILGCEEPELYQHPPQAKHLASVLESLSRGNSQVIVTTHSPYFVIGRDFESVRMARRDENNHCSTIESFSFADFAKRYSEATSDTLKGASAALIKVHQVLQPSLNEMFFTQRLILVEGLEDIAYIQAWLVLRGQWEAFRRYGCHIVAAEGKSELVRPLIIAEGFRIPTIAIFDGDFSAQGKQHENKHKFNNLTLLHLLDGDTTLPFPPSTVWGKRYVEWCENIGDTVERELESSLGAPEFSLIRNEISQSYDFVGGIGKSSLFVGDLLTIASARGGKSPSLDRLCDWIIEFGRLGGQ